MVYMHRIVIGDWSKDGHNESEYFTFTCNYDRLALIEAYKKAVANIGVSLDNDNLPNSVILSRYEDDELDEDVREILTNAGIPLEKLEASKNKWKCTPKDVAVLFLEFVRSQLPDLEYTIIPEVKPINGFWQKDFNVSFGYGCF